MTSNLLSHGASWQPASGARVKGASDPADNVLIECANAECADYRVTGKQRHFPKFWKNTKVVTSSELLGVQRHIS
jgi:hypothetical protein